eukprot:gb/GFBE01082719.1/.p1 GENE.gb/GFBE01082719.1/~~gb/GFBE01082719.1/.p1  ORF type:complete len:377 (+),score=41.56 gb/GFBE01082719.1/:1-1131(+)
MWGRGVRRALRGDEEAVEDASQRRVTGRGLTWWRSIWEGYADVVNAIVRPPRAEYTIDDLGPAEFAFAGHPFRRTDLQVRNSRGLLLECSWWRPAERLGQPQDPLPCVICLHGNSSCRLEALQHMRMVLQRGITLFAFDFAGCGLSQGDTISLGHHEKDDVREIVDYIRGTGQVSTLALWGRSMGAATALLHGHRDPSIAALVLDSPFANLEQVVRELVDRFPIKRKPRFLVNAAIRVVRRSVLKRTGMDILNLKPIENADTCFIPAVFVAGVDDALIHPHHTHDIHEVYAGDKNFIMIEGDHNSERPQYLSDGVSIFFYERLCVPAGLPGELPASGQSTLLPPQSAAMGGDRGESAEEEALQQAILLSLMAPAEG